MFINIKVLDRYLILYYSLTFQHSFNFIIFSFQHSWVKVLLNEIFTELANETLTRSTNNGFKRKIDILMLISIFNHSFSYQ